MFVTYRDIRPEQRKLSGSLVDAIDQAKRFYAQFDGITEIRLTTWQAMLQEGDEAPVGVIVNEWGVFGRLP